MIIIITGNSVLLSNLKKLEVVKRIMIVINVKNNNSIKFINTVLESDFIKQSYKG